MGRIRDPERRTDGSVGAAGQRPNARKGESEQNAIDRSSNGSDEREGKEVCMYESKQEAEANKTHGKKGGLGGIGEKASQEGGREGRRGEGRREEGEEEEEGNGGREGRGRGRMR